MKKTPPALVNIILKIFFNNEIWKNFYNEIFNNKKLDIFYNENF